MPVKYKIIHICYDCEEEVKLDKDGNCSKCGSDCIGWEPTTYRVLDGDGNTIFSGRYTHESAWQHEQEELDRMGQEMEERNYLRSFGRRNYEDYRN